MSNSFKITSLKQFHLQRLVKIVAVDHKIFTILDRAVSNMAYSGNTSQTINICLETISDSHRVHGEQQCEVTDDGVFT